MEYISVVILGVASYIGAEFIGKPIKHCTIYLVLYNYLAVIDLDITGIQ